MHKDYLFIHLRQSFESLKKFNRDALDYYLFGWGELILLNISILKRKSRKNYNNITTWFKDMICLNCNAQVFTCILSNCLLLNLTIN